MNGSNYIDEFIWPDSFMEMKRRMFDDYVCKQAFVPVEFEMFKEIWYGRAPSGIGLSVT